MYYVIKKQENVPFQTFIGFKVPKFIASKKNDTVIFEIPIDGKPTRKWVKKEEIILLTDDKDFFLQTMDKFEKIQQEQKELVEEAKIKLDESITHFSETMHSEIDAFNEIKNDSDIPHILKDF